METVTAADESLMFPLEWFAVAMCPSIRGGHVCRTLVAAMCRGQTPYVGDRINAIPTS